jgi:iron complex outermembrane receptor protein
LGFWILIFTQDIFAQGKEQNRDKEKVEIRADEIQVIEKETRSDLRTEQSDKTGFHSEIDLSKAKNQYTSLPEILEREAGLRVRAFGGLGSYSTLSIRGTNPNQSNFYVDGVPFRNSQSGEVNLSDLPFDTMDSVEIYRSGNPFGLSGSAIGGVVNLKTKKPTEDRSRIQLGGGSFRTAKLTASKSGLVESTDLGYSVFGLQEKSDQNFSFLNDQGTILWNSFDDTVDKRKNANFLRTQGNLNLYWTGFQTDWKLFTDIQNRQNGVPGPGSNQTEKTKRDYTRGILALQSDSPEFLWESLQLETRIFYSGFQDDFFDPRSEFSSGRPNSRAKSDQIGFQVNPTVYLLEYYQVLRFSAGGEWEDFRRDRRTAEHRKIESEPIRNRRFLYGKIEDEFRFFENKLFLIPGLDYEEFRDTYFDESPVQDESPYRNLVTKFTNPKFGLLWKFWNRGKDSIFLKTNISRSARLASFLELFGERGQILGNSRLVPERSENRDLGIGWTKFIFGIELRSELIWFQKDIQDMILFIPNSQFSLRAENLDSAKIQGTEWVQSILWKNWKLKWNYTYQIARNTSDSISFQGKYLPLRPKHELFSQLSYQWTNWETGFDLHYIGAVFRDRTNEYINYLPAREIYGIFLTYKIWESEENRDSLKLNVQIQNISDRQFADFIGYPLPGRNWNAMLTYQF